MTTELTETTAARIFNGVKLNDPMSVFDALLRAVEAGRELERDELIRPQALTMDEEFAEAGRRG